MNFLKLRNNRCINLDLVAKVILIGNSVFFQTAEDNTIACSEFGDAIEAKAKYNQLTNYLCVKVEPQQPTKQTPKAETPAKNTRRRLPVRCCDTQTGEIVVYKNIKEMCDKMGWASGGHMSNKIRNHELHLDRYFITFVTPESNGI